MQGIQDTAEEHVDNTPGSNDSMIDFDSDDALKTGESTDLESSEITELEVPDKINQEAINKKFNRLTFEKYDAKRKQEAVERENEELRRRLAEATGSSKIIKVPPMPDAFDPEFEAKIVERDKAIEAKAAQEAEAKLLETQTNNQKQATIAERKRKIQTRVDKMYKDAKEMGLDEQAFKDADARVAPFLKDPSLAQFILDRDDAAVLIQYLSASATDLEKLSTLPVTQAVAHLITAVVPAASALKPGIPNTPDPMVIPQGKSFKTLNPYLQGVEIE